MYIDTHSHIYLPEFDTDRNLAVQRAIAIGVEKIVLPNIDAASVVPMLSLADTYPQNCFPLMGLHPTSVKENYEDELQIVEQQLKTRKYYGIGEIGIDLYWDTTFKHQQQLAFAHQIELALQYHLPIVIHARNSLPEIFEVLAGFENRMPKGVFHCFPGNVEQAQKAIHYGFFIGIGGIVTFKNSGLDKVVKNIDIQHIVLETDSPYLAPVPHRGKRNESSYIPLVAQKVAEIKNVPLGVVERLTTANALNLFQLPID